MARSRLFIFCFIAALHSGTQVSAAIEKGQPECPSQGVVYIPHEDCSKYYICDNGIVVIMDCPETLYYNPEILQCDYPSSVPECVGGTRPPPPSNSTTSTPPTNSTAPPTNATTPVPPTNSTAPPTNATTPVSPTNSTTPPTNATTPLPPTNSTSPPTNATTPLPPTNSTARPTNATTPLPPTNSTARPTNATTPLPPTNSTEPPTNSTTPPPGNSTTPLPTNGTTPLPNGCPPEGVDKIPNPLSCSSYFICVNGVPILEECADDLQFNPELKECDFPENVNCSTTSPQPITTTTEIPIPECPDEGTAFLPYPGNCSLYILCADGLTLIQQCVNGTCFDPETSQCRKLNGTYYPSEFYIAETKSENALEEFDCMGVGFGVRNGIVLFPSPDGCSKYEVCNGGSHMGTLECHEGFHFDFLVQACIPEFLSECWLDEF